MPKKIKIRCPLTGKKYHILSKKGQTIIRNYKKYQKYQKNNNNTNTMMGGSYTDNVSQNKIQKTVFSTKTMANIALINGQESILDIIRMESNIIYLLHPCIVLNIANTTVKNAALDFIKNPVIDTIKKLQYFFTLEKKNIIQLFKLDGFSQYIIYRMFTFEHFLLSIIEELKLYTLPHLQVLKDNLLSKLYFDKQLFILEIIINYKVKKDEEKSLQSIVDIIKNKNTNINLRGSYKKKITTLLNYRQEHLLDIYENTKIYYLHQLYYFMMTLFTKNNNSFNPKDNYESLLDTTLIEDMKRFIIGIMDSDGDYLNNLKKNIFTCFFLIIYFIQSLKQKNIDHLQNNPDVWKYTLEHHIFNLLIIKDNYMRLGVNNPQLDVHDKCMKELNIIMNVPAFIQNKKTFEEIPSVNSVNNKNETDTIPSNISLSLLDILFRRIQTEFNVVTFVVDEQAKGIIIDNNTAKKLKKVHDTVSMYLPNMTLYKSNTINFNENITERTSVESEQRFVETIKEQLEYYIHTKMKHKPFIVRPVRTPLAPELKSLLKKKERVSFSDDTDFRKKRRVSIPPSPHSLSDPPLSAQQLGFQTTLSSSSPSATSATPVNAQQVASAVDMFDA